jgi:hypothetical protein
VGAKRRHESRLRVQIAEVQAQRRRLEQEPLIVLEHWNAAEWMSTVVLLSAAFVARHDRQLIRLTDLLERPDDP